MSHSFLPTAYRLKSKFFRTRYKILHDELFQPFLPRLISKCSVISSSPIVQAPNLGASSPPWFLLYSLSDPLQILMVLPSKYMQNLTMISHTHWYHASPIHDFLSCGLLEYFVPGFPVVYVACSRMVILPKPKSGHITPLFNALYGFQLTQDQTQSPYNGPRSPTALPLVHFASATWVVPTHQDFCTRYLLFLSVLPPATYMTFSFTLAFTLHLIHEAFPI